MNEVEWMVYFFKGLITIYPELRTYGQFLQRCQIQQNYANVTLIEEDSFCLFFLVKINYFKRYKKEF